jgi:hypothetical protein
VKPWLATILLLVSLVSVMLFAGTLPQHSERAYQCKVLYPLPTLEVKGDFVRNYFEYALQQAKTEVCMLSQPDTVDCGLNEFKMFRGFNTNPDATRCAIDAYRSKRPFIYEEEWSGIDDFHSSWVIGTGTLTIHFIDVGFYASLGSSVDFWVIRCNEPSIEKMYSVDLETFGECNESSVMQQTNYWPYRPQ